MIGLGALINTAAIVAGGVLGLRRSSRSYSAGFLREMVS